MGGGWNVNGLRKQFKKRQIFMREKVGKFEQGGLKRTLKKGTYEHITEMFRESKVEVSACPDGGTISSGGVNLVQGNPGDQRGAFRGRVGDEG